MNKAKSTRRVRLLLRMGSPTCRLHTGNRDPVLELVQLRHTALPTHADDLVASIQRMLHHVLPEFPRGSDDANFHHPISSSAEARN